MRHSLSRKAAMSSLLLTAAWLSPVMADGTVDRPPAEFLFEMIDPAFCMVPPADISDEALIAMLASDDSEMAPPVSGELRHVSDWQAKGQGQFATNDNGLVAGLELVMLDDEERLRYLCLALARHVDTHMTEGEAVLVGPEVTSVEGDAFMVVALVGDRVEGEFQPVGELLTDSGTLELQRQDAESMAGSLSLTGQLDGLEDARHAVSLELEFTELWKDAHMRVVDWDKE